VAPVFHPSKLHEMISLKTMSDIPPPNDEQIPEPQVVPHSRESEDAVIGAILINPEAYYDVAQFLQPDDFYIHRHRWIWQAFMRLNERNAPIDILTVAEELEDRKSVV